jgi:hypothetical protein
VSEKIENLLEELVGEFKTLTTMLGDAMEMISQMTDHLTNAGLEDVHKGIRDGTLEPKNRKAYEKHYGRRRPCPEPCPEEKKD